MFLLGLTVGGIVGGLLGIFVMAIFKSSARGSEDEYYSELEERINKYNEQDIKI